VRALSPALTLNFSIARARSPISSDRWSPGSSTLKSPSPSFASDD
jgi:hypothetical protein